MAMTAEERSDLEEAMASAELLAGNKEALRELNGRVVQLIRDADRQQGQKFLAHFHVGQRVWWESKRRGRRIYGRIVRINPKSVGIDGEDGMRWRVHWSFLNVAEEKERQFTAGDFLNGRQGRVIR